MPLIPLLFPPQILAVEQDAHTALLTKECIAEPVFGESACLYFNDFDDQRDTVVLVHGINGNALTDWKRQIEPLSKRFNILLPDLPGFGSSSKKGMNYSPDNYARFLHYVTQRYLDEPFYLVGHSLGGSVGLLYAAYYPEDIKRLLVADVAGILHKIAFTKLVTESWVSRLFGESAGRIARNLTGEWMNRIEGARPPYVDIDPGDSYSPSVIAGYALIKTNFAPYIPMIQAPVMILWQQEDHVTPLRTGQALAAQLTQGILEVFPGKGHMPMRDAAQRFNEKMLSFFTADERELQQEIKEYKMRSSQPNTDWVGRCENKHNMTFEGDFESLELHRCANVRIINSDIDKLDIYESRFEIINSQIGTIEVDGSEGLITATRITGDTPLTVARSRLDLAGVTIQGQQKSIAITLPSELVFSISQLDSPIFRGPIHGLFQMGKGERL